MYTYIIGEKMRKVLEHVYVAGSKPYISAMISNLIQQCNLEQSHRLDIVDKNRKVSPLFLVLEKEAYHE